MSFLHLSSTGGIDLNSSALLKDSLFVSYILGKISGTFSGKFASVSSFTIEVHCGEIVMHFSEYTWALRPDSYCTVASLE